LGGLAAVVALLLVVLYPPQAGVQGDPLPPPPLPFGGHGRVGVYLTANALTKKGVVEGIFAARREGKIDAVVINVKDMRGDLSYDSRVPLAAQIGASPGRLDLHAIVSALHDNGFYVIARQVLFYDPPLARHLRVSEDWIPADHPVAIEYNLAVAEEVAAFGFDELQFDYIRYADGGALEAVYTDRYAAVDRFLNEARRRLGDRIALSADLFGRVMWPWNERRIDPIGQSLEEMSEHLDFVSPMLYPSHYTEQAYRDDPYRVVTDALRSGSARVQAHYRPFLQAFDMALPAGMTLEAYIREQVRAARDAGADGFLFWHPASDYETLYRALE